MWNSTSVWNMDIHGHVKFWDRVRLRSIRQFGRRCLTGNSLPVVVCAMTSRWLAPVVGRFQSGSGFRRQAGSFQGGPQAIWLTHHGTEPSEQITFAVIDIRRRSCLEKRGLRATAQQPINPGRAGVAQLVEQCIRNAWVGGSSPFAGTSLQYRDSKSALSSGAPVRPGPPRCIHWDLYTWLTISQPYTVPRPAPALRKHMIVQEHSRTRRDDSRSRFPIRPARSRAGECSVPR